jgi:hypothetical protein
MGKDMGPHAESGGEQSGLRLSPPASQTELVLMSRICARWNADILNATCGSSTSPAFLAALAANESGGDPAAQNFEPEVYRDLRAVITGEASSYGSIVAKDLFAAFAENFCFPAQPTATAHASVAPTEPARALTADQDEALRQIATSWGLTQIMGYQIVGSKKTVQNLLDPARHLQYAVRLLEEFGRRFALDLSKDFESLFECWNCGHPGGKTFDPEYVPRGLQRMRLYEGLERDE